MLKRRLHRLVFYNCQSAILLEITRHGSYNLARRCSQELSLWLLFVPEHWLFCCQFFVWVFEQEKIKTIIKGYAA